MKHIKTTYEIVTPESAELGDVEESGWSNEEGESMEPDSRDTGEGITAVDKAIDFFEDKCVEPSSSDFHPGVWYTDADSDIDYRTGAETRESYHLYEFTEEEQERIYRAVI